MGNVVARVDDSRDAEPTVPRTERPDRWWWSVVVATNLPIVIAAVLGIAGGYRPLSDDGILAVRVRDVGTSHNPLLGSATSASTVLDRGLNNLGPLYFDLVAIPARLFGPWRGVVVGVAAVNVVVVSIALVFARRVAGTSGLIAAATVAAGLQWAMRGELLYDIWPPSALILPYLAFLVLVTALAVGDLAALPWLAAVGSLLVQTHLSYAPLVGLLCLGAMVSAWMRSSRPIGDVARSPRWALVAATVVVVAWTQPVIDQVAGRGNLGGVARAGTSAGDAPSVGLSTAVRLAAEVVTGPWFLRGSFEGAIPVTAIAEPIPGLIGGGLAVVVLALVAGVLILAAVAGTNRQRAGGTGLAIVALSAVVVGVLSLGASPINPVGMSAHQMRWLWPTAAFASMAVLVAVADAFRSAGPWAEWAPTRVAVVAASALVLVAVAGAPGRDSDAPGPMGMSRDQGAARDLVRDLGDLRGRGTVLVDVAGLRFLEPYSGLVFAELQHQGVPFVVSDETYVRQFGTGRGDVEEATWRLWQAEGADASSIPAGAEVVGRATGSAGPVVLLIEPYS